MRGKRVLFYDTDPRSLRIAERSLRATRSEVAAVRDVAEAASALAEQRWDLVMLGVNAESDVPALIDLIERADADANTRVTLHATGPTESYLPLLEERPRLCNLIAKNDEPLDPEELIITAEKILRRDLFGLEKYLLWGVEPLSVEVRSSAEKPAYVNEIAAYARSLGCNERSVELVETIADEVVTNAIYNAPRDSDGAPKYAGHSRTDPVVLAPHEAGQLQFACDGENLALAQIDPFGSLTRETVVRYLSRCFIQGSDSFSDETGGAGIGLYRVFNSLSKFIINIAPGRKTEVICLINLRLSMKRFRQAAKSFHVFSEGA